MIGPLNVLYVAEPEKRDPAMRAHVYHLKVHFVSTASMGEMEPEPEVNKEKGLHMIEKALEGLMCLERRVAYY